MPDAPSTKDTPVLDPYPREPMIMERGIENGEEYVVTTCASTGRPTSYGYVVTEAYVDADGRPRLRMKHFKRERA